MATQTRPLTEPATAPSPAAKRAADRAASGRAESTLWLQVAGLSVTAGAVAAGVASLAGQPEWELPALGTGGSLAAIAAGLAARARSRSRRVTRAADRVAPMIGLAEATPYQRSRLLRVRWPLGARRLDPPSRVTVCPPASYPLTDAARLERIADVTGRALRIQLRVGSVHRRRHELVLLPARLEDTENAEPTPRDLRCAEVVVEQRLGAEAAIVATTYDTDGGAQQLDSLDVRFITTEDNTEAQFWVDFEAAFNRQVPGRWQAAPDLVADPVTRQAQCRIRRKPALPTQIPYDLALLDRCGEYEIPYARDEHDRLVTWSLDISPHMLVSGATRSGKSSTIRNVVRGFVARGWAALVCDPRRTGLLGMRGWPGVRALATPTDTRHMVAVIEHVHDEMDRRYAAVEAGLTRRSDLEPILLVLDEYAELHEELALWWARDGANVAGRRRSSEPPVFGLIGSIARLGGEAGVHLVVGIKRPDIDAKLLPQELRNNCRCRCSHGALTRDESQVMWGNADTGRSVPPMIQGRGTAMRADGTPGEVQSLWLPDPLELAADDVDLYRRLEPTASPHSWLAMLGDALFPTTSPPATPWVEATARPHDDDHASGTDAAWDLDEVETDAWDLRYGAVESVPAGDVREADLVEIEDGSQLWVVVDHVTADPDEPDLLYIDGRVVDSGQPKTIVAAEDAFIPRREQLVDGD